MDDGHALAAGPYVLFNPVRAGLVASPLDWEFSSAHHLLGHRDDPLIAKGHEDLLDEWRRIVLDRAGMLAA